MPRHAGFTGLVGFFVYDFPEESHKSEFASGEKKIVHYIFIIVYSIGRTIKYHRLSSKYMINLLPLKAD